MVCRARCSIPERKQKFLTSSVSCYELSDCQRASVVVVVEEKTELALWGQHVAVSAVLRSELR